AGRAGTPAAAVGAARPWTRAGSVAGQRPGRAAGDAEIAAAGPVDDGADHAADPAPERPGQPVMSETGQRVAIITRGSQGNNAGVFVSKPFTDYTAADYALVTGVNLAGFFWLTRRVIADMARRYGGHVVNISASLAEVANSKAPSALAALTKGGVAAVTRSL